MSLPTATESAPLRLDSRVIRRAACLLALAAAALVGIGAPEARADELALAQAVTTESCAPESEHCASERCVGGARSGGGCGEGKRDEDADPPPENAPGGTHGAPPDRDSGDESTSGVGTDRDGSSGGSGGSPENIALSESQKPGPSAASGAGGSGGDDLPFTGLGLGLGAMVLAGLALLAAGLFTARAARAGGHGT